MKILHYSLGFPPYRTGGLTKFCMDLMLQQIKEKHEVSLLWPGEIKLVGKQTRIRKHNAVNEIENYEVINPLPVSFDEGICQFEAFMQPGDKDTYEELLELIKPDVVHVHTLMGLHSNFLRVVKERKIKLVFTAHDFFPICPKVTMFRHGKICSSISSCEECGICNCTALSLRKIQVLQLPVYRKLKDNEFVKRLRKQHRDDYLSDNVNVREVSVGTSDDYKRLREYYYSLLKMMDIIHFNSTVTKKAYEEVFDLPRNAVLSITHGDISDHKKIRLYNDCGLRVRYMGPKAIGKGYEILNEAIRRLWCEGKKPVLDVHFSIEKKPEYVVCHNRFSYADLEEIFDNSDVLVCPSIWYETFGYTVLEALSYGVPIILSGTVGAKDILVNGAGIIIEDIDAEKLYQALNHLNAATLSAMNKTIVDTQVIQTMSDLSKEIMEKVY